MDSVLDKHRKNALQLASLLENHPKIKLLKTYEGTQSSYWVYTLRLQVQEQRRDLIMANLNEKGVGAGLVHLPNDRYSAFSKFKRKLVNTELFSSTQISLPCGWWLSSTDIDFIANTLIDELNSEHD
jgi:dTDP-4-amino-4,6-dideoxygalactose transaminase